jgi:hypothetical protein
MPPSPLVLTAERLPAGNLPNLLEIEISVHPAKTSIKLRGEISALIEGSTFLVWLSTAIRAAPQDRLCYCTADIQQIGTASAAIIYTYDIFPQILPAGCWCEMFRNPVVTKGYSITPRPTGKHGLEMSFDMMTILAQTPFLASFAGATILKGYSTILSLSRCEEKFFNWHFLIDQSRQRMPYNEGLRAAQTGLIVNENDLRTGRHFVGWTPNVNVLAGK